ncbi:DNA-binding response regulator [Salipaludibacillus neizhouensis]|uniref:DNA-binding response regulator n=1 Tax=Salipaludibacillus neizhouensis TaxID=885475 RepID=A0A3A9KKL3_9BACI|nr:response regulator [Salipaludibacillus neizhouensis]RKL65426.1 DNA-binding response regulator [Salipaludibacillus neizhouensis]
MIKVMLVDDEPLEREGLKLMLSKNRSGFEVIAEAKNGNQAVDLALEKNPDLIFMDIKMPQLDGLQAIQKIIDVYPTIKCIMVSAFDTFDYARQAMKYGIKEYLLKPSKVSEVLEAFDRMVEEIEAERKQGTEMLEMTQRLERVSSFIEMEFIVSSLLDHVHEFDQADWNEWLHLDQSQGFVVVFSFDSTRLQPDRNEKSRWYRILKQALHDQRHPCLVGPLTGFQVPTLLLLNKEEEATLEMRQDFARSIIHQVQNQLEACSVLAGIGTIVSDVHQFSRSYEEAIYALELVYKHASASYMTYSDHMKQKRTELIPFEVEKELVNSVKKGDIQKGLHLFDTYFQLIHQASESKVEMIKKAMENFFIILTRSMKEFGFDEDVQMSFDTLETSMQIKERAKTHLSVIIERLGEWRTSGVESLLLQAKEYIDNNYHKTVMLEEVAETIGLSSYYLSKLFKDKFQVTFIDYLTNTRIQKAKDLLLDGKTPLKEIAMNIGYKDPNYFSRVFKKEMGLSPREYRSKYQQ